jgi:hypothetical protein
MYKFNQKEMQEQKIYGVNVWGGADTLYAENIEKAVEALEIMETRPEEYGKVSLFIGIPGIDCPLIVKYTL